MRRDDVLPDLGVARDLMVAVLMHEQPLLHPGRGGLVIADVEQKPSRHQIPFPKTHTAVPGRTVSRTAGWVKRFRRIGSKRNNAPRRAGPWTSRDQPWPRRFFAEALIASY